MSERRALMGSPEARQRQLQMRSEADLAGSAEGITASLQRTRQQMAQVQGLGFPSSIQISQRESLPSVSVDPPKALLKEAFRRLE